MAHLITHVHVQDEDGGSHVFGPGDEVPSWAQVQITNPKAWDAVPSAPEVKPATPRVTRKTAPKRAANE